MYKGGCQCGGVRFVVTGSLRAPDACHCAQCRRFSGHVFASTDVSSEALSVEQDQTLVWYSCSEKVRRGFCGRCGSSLFWDPLHHDTIAIAMGAFDGPTDTRLGVHIFVSEKGDYYDIGDGLPQHLR